MKHRLLSTALFAAASGATALAGDFSVSGAGGAIPDYPIPGVPGTWNDQPSWAIFTGSVVVANDVTSITSIEVLGLDHAFRGDLHFYLNNPAGTRFNIVVRPGYDGSLTGYGDGGNYDLGDFTFVESGGEDVAQGATDIPPGTYNQYLNTGAGMWTSGSYPIDNTPLSMITGSSGIWTLTIVDWASPDAGSITGWTLSGVDITGMVTPMCFGDATVNLCPCANNGAAGRGCQNSVTPGGARLTSTGEASLSADTLVLTSSGELATSISIFLQGNVEISPLRFGDGLRCAGGYLRRLYTKNAVGGVVTAPTGTELSVSARSNELGGRIPAFETRVYQVYYRDGSAAFCPPPNGSTFNVSNGLKAFWGT